MAPSQDLYELINAAGIKATERTAVSLTTVI